MSAAARRRTAGTVEAPAPWWLRLSPARVALAVGTPLLLSLLLCVHLLPRVTLRVGDVASERIVAHRTVRYADREQNRQSREAAAAGVAPVFDVQPDALVNARTTLDAVVGVLHESAGYAPSTKPLPRPAGLSEQIARRTRTAVAPTLVSALLALNSEEREEVRRIGRALVDEAMSRPITDQPGELERARREIARSPVLKAVPDRLRGPAVALAVVAVTPNQLVDARRTRQERERARSAVVVQTHLLPAGDTVLRPGDAVTQQHLDKLAALGLIEPRLNLLTAGLISVLVTLLVVLVAAFVKCFEAALFADTRRLFLLALLSVISVVGLKVGSTLLDLPISGVQFGYLGMMCVASAGMAIALLLSPAVATLVVALLSVVSGFVLNHELRFAVITLGSSLVGIVSVANLRNRGDLVRATVHLCAANVLLILIVGELEGESARELTSGLLWGVISGLFALALFWVGVAAFEKPFGITTHLRLLDLSDPATPLLQELRLRAPGTYAHSLMVGNLAHAAAEAIGADGLLARVAAYYHDVGKMNRPEFFVENQGGADNIHDRLSPYMSALVLTSHVKEGLEIADEIGLPTRVRDLIEQHHGTTLMKYFHHRAVQEGASADDPLLEAQFRYAGPKPRTKEAAILMLADSVEAASRCLDKPTPARIRDFVARLVEDKRGDGQLDDCDLTLRELQSVQDVFARTLSGVLHARVVYPGDGASRRPSLPAAAAPPPPAAVSAAPVPAEATVPLAGGGALTMVSGGDDSPAIAQEVVTTTHGDRDPEHTAGYPADDGPRPRGRGNAAAPRR